MYVQTQDLLNKQLLSDSRVQRFYSILAALLSSDGIKIPPLYAPTAKQFIPQLSDSWEQIKSITGSGNIKAIEASTRLVYIAARARLLHGRVPISFKSIMGQMKNAKVLLESAFPGYSRLIARELGGQTNFGVAVGLITEKPRCF